MDQPPPEPPKVVPTGVTGQHPVVDRTGQHAHANETGRHRVSWNGIPVPAGVSGLEDMCLWLNFLDGLLTAHALTSGHYTELNVMMRTAWSVSPLLYGTLKFWLFWLGLKMMERSALKRNNHKVRERVLIVVFGLFLLVLMWHLRVLRGSH